MSESTPEGKNTIENISDLSAENLFSKQNGYDYLLKRIDGLRTEHFLYLGLSREVVLRHLIEMSVGSIYGPKYNGVSEVFINILAAVDRGAWGLHYLTEELQLLYETQDYHYLMVRLFGNDKVFEQTDAEGIINVALKSMTRSIQLLKAASN